ncbi:heparinase II/III domain-containing protein [Paenibacillus daejeonensis]|uniref:heparinase II/III domain-containing protein n=1 Tax=Paenibacillus daejeonensis TaxID=135193 RepID=UPI00037A02B9|nr:heparinase II/III family protein [Paenibacillus daejeonensis]
MNIQEKLAELDWCGAELKVLQEELDQVMRKGSSVSTAADHANSQATEDVGEHAVPHPQIPTEPGGWWHQYVCPEHHTELLFDPLEEDAHSYRCPYGCELAGDAYRGAWLVYRHQAWARYALQAAVVHAGTGEMVYAELGRQIIVRYARLFPHYPVHPDAQPWMLKGRAFHQALTEAIWATTLLRAYVLLRDEGVSFEEDREALDIFLDLLKSSLREYHGILVHKRGEPENNYTAWLIAALASIYAVRGERDELVDLITAEGGFQHHLDLAIRSDGLEFEGSVYYHVFVLRAYFITAEMAERCGLLLWDAAGEDGQTLQGMCDVLVSLADGNGRLAALHDGPYDRVPYAREIAEVLEIGLARYGNKAYEPLLAEAYRQLSGESQRSGLEAVLYGSGGRELKTVLPCPVSGLLPESGWAMLSHPGNPLSALVDYGPHGGSHGHFDKLNLMLGHRAAPVAPDRGTVPYGSPLKKGWYPHTACHNTVTIGGRSQSAAAGACRKLEITQESAYAWLETTEAYSGSRLARHVMVTADWVLDWFEVELETEAEIDWWFHYIGEAVEVVEETHSGGTMNPLIEWQPHEGTLGTEDGYAYIRPTKSLLSDGTPLKLRIEASREAEDVVSREAEEVTRSAAGEVTQAGTVEGTADGTVNPDLEAGRANADKEAGLVDAARMEPVFLQGLPTAGTEIIRVQSPGLTTDPSREMEGILMRCRGTTARFVAVYSASKACPHVQLDEAGRIGIKQAGKLRTYQMTQDGLMEEGAL